MVTSSRTDRSRISDAGLQHRADGPSAIASAGVMPNSETVPASGGNSPSTMSIVVDLPAPLGPSSATVSPGAIEMPTPRTACTGP